MKEKFFRRSKGTGVDKTGKNGKFWTEELWGIKGENAVRKERHPKTYEETPRGAVKPRRLYLTPSRMKRREFENEGGSFSHVCGP